MSQEVFKCFFKVVDLFEIKGRLAVVSDISDPGDYRPGEIVEIHRPDGTVLTAQGFVLLYEEPEGKPFTMFFTNLVAADIPVGAEVWLRKERPVSKPSRHYERR